MSDKNIDRVGAGTAVATTGNRSARSRRLMATTALVSLALGTLSLLMPDAARAGCGIVGTGTVFMPQTGDVVSCSGLGINDAINPNAQSDVTINIGDGSTPTSLAPPISTPVNFNATTSSSVTIRNGAGIQSAADGIQLGTGSNFNQVTIETSGFLSANNLVGSAAVSVGDSNGNTVNVYGVVQGLAPGVAGIKATGTSTNNIFWVRSGGVVTGIDNAIDLGATDGNTIYNEGTIAALNSEAIVAFGSVNIGNYGTITAGSGGTAVQLGGGVDRLILYPGSAIIGNVRAGAGSDSLILSGNSGQEALFNLNLLGPGQQYDEFEIFQKNGGSVWTLTGTSTFNGSTDIAAGGLVVNGVLPSIVTVNGGYLGGTGTISGFVNAFGGTVAPGNSIGTLNVNGNVTFDNGSFYNVEINGAGQSDLVNATGTATLNGGTVNITPLGTGFHANTRYTILTAAGGVTGTFSALAPLVAPLVQAQLTYDANNAYFLLQQVAGFGTLSGLTPNQQGVSGALDQASLGGASASLTNAINTVAALSDAGIRRGLDDLAGQGLADSRRFTVDQSNAFHNFMWDAGVLGQGNVARVFVPTAASYASGPDDPIRDAMAGNSMASKAPARAAAGSSYGVWTGAFGNWDRVSASSIAFGANSVSGGAAIGIEHNGDRFRVGVVAGASTGKLTSAGRADSVTGDAGHIGAYGRGEIAGLDVAGAISYAFASLDSMRAIGFLGQTATGDWRAHTLAATFGLSRVFRFGNASAEPFARLDWTGTHHQALDETGAPGVNQLVRAGHDDVFSGSSGVRLAYRTTGVNGLPASLGTTFGVRHDFSGNTPSMVTSFEGAPNIPFIITGVARPATRLLAGAEVAWSFTATTALSATYESAFATDYIQHRLQAVLKTAF
ncbi:MAG: autotransporter domain-containing protein [Pseudomonadota bacterium]